MSGFGSGSAQCLGLGLCVHKVLAWVYTRSGSGSLSAQGLGPGLYLHKVWVSVCTRSGSGSQSAQGLGLGPGLYLHKVWVSVCTRSWSGSTRGLGLGLGLYKVWVCTRFGSGSGSARETYSTTAAVGARSATPLDWLASKSFARSCRLEILSQRPTVIVEGAVSWREANHTHTLPPPVLDLAIWPSTIAPSMMRPR